MSYFCETDARYQNKMDELFDKIADKLIAQLGGIESQRSIQYDQYEFAGRSMNADSCS